MLRPAQRLEVAQPASGLPSMCQRQPGGLSRLTGAGPCLGSEPESCWLQSLANLTLGAENQEGVFAAATRLPEGDHWRTLLYAQGVAWCHKGAKLQGCPRPTASPSHVHVHCGETHLGSFLGKGAYKFFKIQNKIQIIL